MEFSPWLRFNASTLQRFNASTLQRFNASTLQRFNASLVGFRGFRSAALLAAASLALAACGGGESTDPARKSRLDQRDKDQDARELALDGREATVSQKEKTQAAKDTELDRREAAVEAAGKDPEVKANQDARKAALDAREQRLNTRQAGLNTRESQLNTRQQQATATQFAGFSTTETVNLGNVVQEIAGNKVALSYLSNRSRSSYNTRRSTSVMIPNVIPALQDDELIYRFDYHNVGSLGRLGLVDYFGSAITTYPKTFSFNQNSYTATNFDLGLGEKFDARILKTEVDTSGSNSANDAKLHIEIATDYSGDNKTDWITWGYWLQVPRVETLNFSSYSVGSFAIPNKPYGPLDVALTGTATYKGAMLGLHTSLRNSEVKVNIDLNFGDATSNTVTTTTLVFNQLKLDNQNVSGQFQLANVDHQAVGNNNSGLELYGVVPDRMAINGVKYDSGFLQIMYTGPKPNNTTPPSGIAGSITGKTNDGINSFIASFGAKKQ